MALVLFLKNILIRLSHPSVIRSFFFFLQCNFISLFLTVLGLHYCVQALTSCERGLLFVVATGFSLRWLLVEYRLERTGCSGRGTWAQELSSQALEHRCSSCDALA